jgi:hypothetical protein
MKAQLLTATLFTTFSGVLSAADPMLLNLVMPDAKVVAGVNVQQAKGTLFGQYILSQMQTTDAHMQELVALTGFDPRRDVIELLVASNAAPAANHEPNKVGLALALGTFDVGMITAAATQHGAVTELYNNNITIIEDPKQEGGIAFLSPTIVVAGDIASVKGAIDRQTMPQPLPSTVTMQIGQWGTQDAWAVSTVSPMSMAGPPKGGQTNPMAGAVQAVQSAGGGVKFGTNVVFSGQATCDTAQNAKTLSDLMQLMLNMAQMQAGSDPKAAALIQNTKITVNQNAITVSASLPQDVFTQMVAPKNEMERNRMQRRK